MGSGKTEWAIQYMNENPDVSMIEMLNEKDAQGILQHSGYKPEK
jgi:hypothetical protein